MGIRLGEGIFEETTDPVPEPHISLEERRHRELLDALAAVHRQFVGVQETLRALIEVVRTQPNPIDQSQPVDLTATNEHLDAIHQRLVDPLSVTGSVQTRRAPLDERFEWEMTGKRGTKPGKRRIIYHATAPPGTLGDSPEWRISKFVYGPTGPTERLTRIGSWTQRQELFG